MKQQHFSGKVVVFLEQNQNSDHIKHRHGGGGLGGVGGGGGVGEVFQLLDVAISSASGQTHFA